MKVSKGSFTFIKGGPGSGHRGHRGRPGKRGGSVSGGGTVAPATPPKKAKPVTRAPQE